VLTRAAHDEAVGHQVPSEEVSAGRAGGEAGAPKANVASDRTLPERPAPTTKELLVPYTGDVTVGGDADVRTAGALQVTKVGDAARSRTTATCCAAPRPGDTLLVDAAGDAPLLLSLVGDGRLVGVLETHGHWDHVQALAEVTRRPGAPSRPRRRRRDAARAWPTGSSRTARR
jgi:glyoxylase-like metal-dependent hydrolase (beta-lactamase superfamily II)